VNLAKSQKESKNEGEKRQQSDQGPNTIKKRLWGGTKVGQSGRWVPHRKNKRGTWGTKTTCHVKVWGERGTTQTNRTAAAIQDGKRVLEGGATQRAGGDNRERAQQKSPL